jgi:hypothetical protein|tara:strand:+ start:208 stop:390 length:183 start_codon:yes stop_codon:yes gene_type:complete
VSFWVEILLKQVKEKGVEVINGKSSTKSTTKVIWKIKKPFITFRYVSQCAGAAYCAVGMS